MITARLKAISLLLAVLVSATTYAATFTVTTTADSGAGSLRQAILSANASVNTPDFIQFAIPGAGPYSITPVTPLPLVTDPATIDGYTQSGASQNSLALGNNAVLKIQVSGSLVIDTTNSTVRGLALRQLQLGNAPGPKGGNTIQGNFIGLDASGTNALGSTGSGIFVQTPSNIIGGGLPSSRNLVSGHGTTGMEIFEAFASGNLVQNNYIGTDRHGTNAIPNTDRALVVNQNAFGNTISDNVISGNLNRGVTLDGFNNLVRGNYIGTDPTGTQPLGNARSGVEITGPGNTVGGTNAGAGNVIAFNGVDGGGVFTTNGVDVAVGTTAFAILGNLIFDNKGMGIDLNMNSVPTPGYVVITVASNTTANTFIRGTHTPGTHRLELFNNLVPDASGYGEGRMLLGFTNITTDAGGNFSFNWPLAIPPGMFITATANGTNEFSQARMVVAAGGPNSWVSGVGGKWENGPSWSLGVAPYAGHSYVLITNAGSKTVTNDATTASTFPTTMTITNLLIAAPGGATNTFRLAHSGTTTPLTIRSNITVNGGGAMAIDNAALIVESRGIGGFKIDGSVRMASGLMLVTNTFGPQLYIGNNGRGELVVSNGTLITSYAIVGVNDGSDGTWRIAGGSNVVTTTFDIADSLTATGRVAMTGGTLSLPGAYIGLFGNGQFAVSNGIVQSAGNALIGSQPGSQGALIAAGGSTTFGSMQIRESTQAAGSVLVTGTGLLQVNGPLENRGGSVTVAGGGFSVLGQLESEVPGNSIVVSAGTFKATNDNAFLTSVAVSGGTFLARDVFLGNQKTGTFTVSGGTVALPGSFNGFSVGVNGGTGVVSQVGGEIILTNTDFNLGGLFSPATGTMTISNGTTFTYNAYIGGQGGGTGVVSIAGGTLVSTNLEVNTGSRVTLNYGSLQVRGANFANNLPFVVGDGGGNPAIYKLLGGTNAFASSVRILSNGLLTGTGTIQSPLTNVGVIAPGDGIGRILITGALVLSNSSALRFEIGGTAPGTQYDQLNISNAVVQAGTVQVQLTNAFTPSAGQVFQLVNALSRSGTFSAVNLPALPAGLGWTNRLAVDGTLGVIAVPTPAQLINATMLGNGSFQFGFSNIANGTFSILASTNVTLPINNWTVLGAPTQPSPGYYQFTDPNAPIHTKRFYRVRSP